MINLENQKEYWVNVYDSGHNIKYSSKEYAYFEGYLVRPFGNMVYRIHVKMKKTPMQKAFEEAGKEIIKLIPEIYK